ncbi:MAG: Ldh family oxidoreductase [Anaerolineae bacterium]|nr:Ldh family oxidoreductase [Anaerolineae bacterium]
MKVAIDELRDVTRRAIAAQGYEQADTETVLDIIMYAQLRGNNQNVIKLLGAGMPADPAAGEITVVKDSKLSALLDGSWNQGMVVLSRATQLTIDKAQAHGFGIVGTQRTNSPTGAIGYYARWMAEQGLIGFVCSGAPELMAMHGSYEPFLGTNPLAIGIPSAGKPLVFDMATAAIAWYGVILAKAEGDTIPEGLAYDAEGRLTTDPEAALAGAIKAFGGYKGAALALIVETLTRPLVGATRKEDGTKLDWGNLVFAIDPELLADDLETFQAGVSDLLSRVKQLKKLPGVDEILVPGERGDRVFERNTAAGALDLDERVWRELNEVADLADNAD